MKALMFALRRASLVFVAPALAACATASLPVVKADAHARAAPPPTPAEVLMKPCASASDIYPWQLTDMWDDDLDPYRPKMRFKEGGVVAYAYQGMAFENGRWTLDGEALSIDMNDHHTDYTGVFDGKMGSGKIKNVDGDTGKWTLMRVCEG